MSTRTTIQTTAQTADLAVLPPFPEAPDALQLTSPDGSWRVMVPRDLFPAFLPGEHAIASLTLTRALIEPAPEKLVDLGSPGLIIGKAN